jgi:hypothetical protein
MAIKIGRFVIIVLWTFFSINLAGMDFMWLSHCLDLDNWDNLYLEGPINSKYNEKQVGQDVLRMNHIQMTMDQEPYGPFLEYAVTEQSEENTKKRKRDIAFNQDDSESLLSLEGPSSDCAIDMSEVSEYSSDAKILQMILEKEPLENILRRCKVKRKSSRDRHINHLLKIAKILQMIQAKEPLENILKQCNLKNKSILNRHISQLYRIGKISSGETLYLKNTKCRVGRTDETRNAVRRFMNERAKTNQKPAKSFNELCKEFNNSPYNINRAITTSTFTRRVRDLYKYATVTDPERLSDDAWRLFEAIGVL